MLPKSLKFNMKDFLLLLFLIPLLANCQSEKNAVSKYPSHVGNITFDEKIDDFDFQRCLNEKFAFQYYNDSKGFQYVGEKIEIDEKLKKINFKEDQNANGYVTIRYVVNCEGKTGMFRVQQMDSNYLQISFNKEMITQILNFTKNLKGWIPKEIQNRKIDYYQYLTFKIKNGNVSEVLP